MRFIRCLLRLTVLAAALQLHAKEKMADGLYAEFTTPRGSFVVELKHREVPLTVANFVGLAEGTIAPRNGAPYYTGLKWYRVVPGFVIQSGNPRAPEDSDPGYTFPDEFAPGLHHGAAGILSMANAGPDTNSAEFFITLGDCTRLNYLHSVFGHVFTGGEVLSKIQAGDAFSIKILRMGEAGRAFKADEATFKALVAQAPKYSGTAEPGPAAHFDDPDKLIPVDPPRAKNFNFKLANFARVTGVKIVGRMFAQPPPAEQDREPGAVMRALADQLGLARSGVLVAFFAPDDWRVWFGDELVPAFLGRPAAPADLGDGGGLHDAKEALIATALRKGDTDYAAQQKAAPADRPVPASQHLKLQMDALLDALILRLEPK